MKTIVLTISRFLFGTATILHIGAILIWFMIPREPIIYFAQKSFYPPFIHSYAVKYQQAKDVYEKTQKQYSSDVNFLEEWISAKITFEEKEHELVSYVLLNTFIMAIIFLVCWIVLKEKLENIRIEGDLGKTTGKIKMKNKKIR